MCRWLSYTGSPVLLDELLYKPAHSLIVQSLHATMGAETTNGDGFGVGWYGDQATPGVFHSTDVRTLRHQYPDNPVLHAVSDQTRLVVSEPLGDLKGAWRAVPEATSVLIEGGREELRPFTPRPGRSGATVTGG